MKKILFFVAAVVFAVCFTACENSEKGKNKLTINTEGAEVASAMTIYEEGPVDYRFPSLRQYTFEAYTGTVNYDPIADEITGTGIVFQLSQALSFTEANTPLATGYTPFEIVNNMVSEVYSGGAVALQFFVIEDGEIRQEVSDYTYDFKAEVLQGDDKMTFAIEGNFADGRKVFLFEGTPTIFVASPYTTEDVEPDDVFNGDVKYTKAQVIYYGNTDNPFLPLNLIEINLVDDNFETLADIFCYGSLEDETNVYGTFKVNSKHEEGAAAQSPGLFVDEDGQAYPSPSFVVLNEYDYYLVQDGEITIEEGKITFDITSLNGSQISTTFEGNLDVVSVKDFNAPRANAPALKKAKRIATPLNYNLIVKF